MKIVNREEFLKLPPGTVYVKLGGLDKSNMFLDMTHSELYVKDDNCRESDFYYYELYPWPENCVGYGDVIKTISAAIEGKPTDPLDIGKCVERDDLYDEFQFFGVYEKEEVERLVRLFQKCLATAYSSS